MNRYAYQVRVETLGYKPRGKAGKHVVSTSWATAGQTGRSLETSYFASRVIADRYAAAQRARFTLEAA